MSTRQIAILTDLKVSSAPGGALLISAKRLFLVPGCLVLLSAAPLDALRHVRMPGL